jgi:GAF domain-containing protein
VRAVIETELVLAALTTFARTMASGLVVADVLVELCRRATGMLDIAGAGVTLVDGDRLTVAAATGEPMADMARAEEKHQEGPCIETLRSGRVTLVDDIARERERWPHVFAQAVEGGLCAMAAVPLGGAGPPVGVLALYDHAPRTWTEDEIRAVRLLVDVATGFVVSAAELDRQRRTADQLQHALDSRVIIEQAKGMVAAQRGVSVDEAFKRLRKHANDHNATLRSTAEAVVNVGLQL